MARMMAGLQRLQLREARQCLREAGRLLRAHTQHCTICRNISLGAEQICPQAADLQMSVKRAGRLVQQMLHDQAAGQGMLI